VVASAVVALLGLVGSVASWGNDLGGHARHLSQHGTRGAAAHAVVRVGCPSCHGIAIVVGIAIALTLKHYLHPTNASLYAIWMLSFGGCLLPVLVYVAIHARRLNSRR